jgi:hypothetical protein
VRRLGLAKLTWGRIHRPFATTVYDAIELRCGRTWTRAAHWSDAGVHESDVFDLPRLEAFESSRTLHAGDAVDDARFPGTIERLASRLVTGPAVERRCLSKASDGGCALHETVRFG